MKLREHPLLSYRGIPSWPAVWLWTDGQEDKKPIREVGTLSEVRLSLIEPRTNVSLSSILMRQSIWACLLINDLAFCAQIAQLLQGYYGYSIRDIGDIDLSRTL